MNIEKSLGYKWCHEYFESLDDDELLDNNRYIKRINGQDASREDVDGSLITYMYSMKYCGHMVKQVISSKNSNLTIKG
jgi:hypothetical protein